MTLSKEPLSCLAIGLLGLAMESSEIAGEQKDINYQMVPIIIGKLQELNEKLTKSAQSSPPSKKTRYSSPTIEIENTGL